MIVVLLTDRRGDTAVFGPFNVIGAITADEFIERVVAESPDEYRVETRVVRKPDRWA